MRFIFVTIREAFGGWVSQKYKKKTFTKRAFLLQYLFCPLC